MTRVRNIGALTDGLQYSPLDLGTVVGDGAVGIVVAGGEARMSGQSGANCIKIGLPGKSIPRDYFQEKRSSCRPILRISVPGRSIFIQFVPGNILRGHHDDVRLLDGGRAPALL